MQSQRNVKQKPYFISRHVITFFLLMNALEIPLPATIHKMKPKESSLQRANISFMKDPSS